MKVERKVQISLEKAVSDERIVLLTGARQTGKTWLLRQLGEKLRLAGERVHFFSFEDPLFLADLNKHPANIFDYISTKPQEKTFLLLDEIQYLDDPSNFLKYLYDLHGDNLKLIATGSSAFYMDAKFRDSLAGRKKILPVYPFCFSEFLLARGDTSLAALAVAQPTNGRKKFLTKPQRREMLAAMQEYFLYGGYPAVVCEKDPAEKESRLRELYQSLLKKDVAEAGIRNETAFYALLKTLAAQVGSLTNPHELGRDLGISRTAIENYLQVLQKSWIIGICRPFHSSVRKELTKMPKFFFYDSGYRNAILGTFMRMPDHSLAGSVVENAFFSENKKAGIEEISFWRTQAGQEVDFVLEGNNAYEIKTSLARFSISRYRSFTEAYPAIPLLPVAWHSETALEILDFCH